MAKLRDWVGFTLLGKADTTPVHVIMWQIDDLPMLCLLKHLLAWIYLTGIPSGYLLPSQDELDRIVEMRKNDPSCHIYCKEGISYTVLSQIKSTCVVSIPYRSGPFGTHCMRKTGYLLAFWGGGEDSDVFKCARHKTASMGANYKRDALGLMPVANAQNRNEHDNCDLSEHKRYRFRSRRRQKLYGVKIGMRAAFNAMAALLALLQPPLQVPSDYLAQPPPLKSKSEFDGAQTRDVGYQRLCETQFPSTQVTYWQMFIIASSPHPTLYLPASISVVETRPIKGLRS
ncbi:hypothetical protein CcCBS67573_g00496 [Chytriomyces confervae]|uniref:Uncharacterized protein n=1 Tax=Chytriomyces confervae TaxID=246404 RepID=A0A507FS37_9FUNG|nr:hypothetical protein CcCBS67573_g00496 [Chytriomyces confervae]